VKRNFGHKSLREVQDKLAALGLTLGMTLDAPTYAEAVTAAVVAGMEAAAEAHAERDDPEPRRAEDAQPPLSLDPGASTTAASPVVDLLER